MKDNYEASLALVLKSEGGFTDDPRDSGNHLPDGRAGCTNLGVTQAAWESYLGHPVSTADMKTLTPEKVAPFYKLKYWNPTYGDVLPVGVDYLLFDFGVNSGPGNSVKIFQGAIGCVPDGAIGPNTMAVINKTDPKVLIDKFSRAKENFYKSLKTFPVFGAGWLKRVNDVEQNALKMIG